MTPFLVNLSLNLGKIVERCLQWEFLIFTRLLFYNWETNTHFKTNNSCSRIVFFSPITLIHILKLIIHALELYCFFHRLFILLDVQNIDMFTTGNSHRVFSNRDFPQELEIVWILMVAYRIF